MENLVQNELFINGRLSKAQKRFLDPLIQELSTMIHGPATSLLETLAFINSYPTFSPEKLNQAVRRLSVNITPFRLFRDDPALYYNLMIRFRSLENAFAAFGIEYANPVLENWQANAIEYLGIIPDSKIAAIFGKTNQSVQDCRVKMGIMSASENICEIETSDDAVTEIRRDNREKFAQYVTEKESRDFRNFRDEVISIIGCHLDATDKEIAEILCEHGYSVGVRTVCKYRKQMGYGKVYQGLKSKVASLVRGNPRITDQEIQEQLTMYGCAPDLEKIASYGQEIRSQIVKGMVSSGDPKALLEYLRANPDATGQEINLFFLGQNAKFTAVEIQSCRKAVRAERRAKAAKASFRRTADHVTDPVVVKIISSNPHRNNAFLASKLSEAGIHLGSSQIASLRSRLKRQAQF